MILIFKGNNCQAWWCTPVLTQRGWELRELTMLPGPWPCCSLPPSKWLFFLHGAGLVLPGFLSLLKKRIIPLYPSVLQSCALGLCSVWIYPKYISTDGNIPNQGGFRGLFLLCDTPVDFLCQVIWKRCKCSTVSPRAGLMWWASWLLLPVWFSWHSKDYQDILSPWKTSCVRWGGVSQ